MLERRVSAAGDLRLGALPPAALFLAGRRRFGKWLHLHGLHLHRLNHHRFAADSFDTSRFNRRRLRLGSAGRVNWRRNSFGRPLGRGDAWSKLLDAL